MGLQGYLRADSLVGIAKFSFQLLPVSLDPAQNGWIAHF